MTRILVLYERRSKLSSRKTEIESQPTKREGDALAVGPDSTTAFKFGETVKRVLTAWHFPHADKVQFDPQTSDITIAGKGRVANGKGARAILHAAFNVAVIVYAIENQLLHPGFLVLEPSIARIVALRKEGTGATAIATAVGCKRGSVYNALKATGLN